MRSIIEDLHEIGDDVFEDLRSLEARSANGNGNNGENGDFGAVGQTFVRIAENSYTDGVELMARARPLEWSPGGTTTDAALTPPPGGRQVFLNNGADEIPQGRVGGDTGIWRDGSALTADRIAEDGSGVFLRPDGVTLFRIPLSDDLRFVNQPTDAETPQARDISERVFNQDLDGDGDDEDLPTPFGANDFHLFFGQALTHDMVETQVNVTAISIPSSTGVGWAGGRVDADGNPTAAVLVRVDPDTGQTLRDQFGAPIIVPVSLDDLRNPPGGGLPAVSGYAAVSRSQLEAAWDAYVNHQALSLGAPFALQRTPGVYDEDGVRQQANTETAFLDLGNVYGKVVTARVREASIVDRDKFLSIGDDPDGDGFVTVRVDTTQWLRDGARLLTSDDVDSPRNGENLLPTYGEVNAHQNLFRDVDGAVNQQGQPIDERTQSMGAVFDPTLEAFFSLDRFAAGDQRVNQNIATVTQQTVWMRNHNAWVDVLEEKVAGQGWSSEQTFNLARALNEAEYQKAVYDEYLPTLIGEAGMAMMGNYAGYDPNANPGVINEWTTIAFRFGHDQSSDFVTALMEDGDVAERVPLIRSFTLAGEGAASSAPDEQALDTWLRGQLAATHQALDGYVVQGNRGQLFGVVTSPVTGQPVINDLTVFDVVRGRDHGVNSYVKLRQALGLDDYTGAGTGEAAFDAWAADNPTLVTDARLAAVKELYGNDFAKLDAYVGVLLEEKHGDSQLGISSTMLIAMQFAATRDGDRLWYENRFKDQPELLALIEESSMAEVIERTSGVEHAYRDAFLAHDRIGGTEGGERLRGDGDKDLLIGFGGNDRLEGGAEDDDLHGGAGNDKLNGDAGSDRKSGGAGKDEFRFRAADLRSGDRDVIEDFSVAEGDVIIFQNQRGIFGGETGDGQITTLAEFGRIVARLNTDGDLSTNGSVEPDAVALGWNGGYRLRIEGAEGVDGTDNADLSDHFERATFSANRGNVQDTPGVELVGLTDERIAFDVAGDVIVFGGEGVSGLLAGFSTGADAGDGKSRFSVLDAEGGTIIGAGAIRDLVGGFSRGTRDATNLLKAGLEDDARVELIGLDADSFAVRIVNEGKNTTDTVLFTAAEDVVAAVRDEEGFKGAFDRWDEADFLV